MQTLTPFSHTVTQYSNFCIVILTWHLVFTLISMTLDFHYYRPQRSWGKVILSVVCVKNSVHRGVCHIAYWYTPPTHQEQTPPSAVHVGRYGQLAGGTHPTGMHTCFLSIWTSCLHLNFSICCETIFWMAAWLVVSFKNNRCVSLCKRT